MANPRDERNDEMPPELSDETRNMADENEDDEFEDTEDLDEEDEEDEGAI